MADVVSGLSYLYGAMLILGGAMGAMKGSTASLMAGGGSGVAVIALELTLAGLANAGGARNAVQAVQLTLTGGLLYVMGGRYMASGKIMPAGIVAGLSGLCALAYASRILGVVGTKAHTA